MSTSRTKVSSNSYVKVSNSNKILIQNTGTTQLRVVYTATLPIKDYEHYHVLSRGQFVNTANNSHTGDAYARADLEDSIGYITVTE